jgi:ABC-type Fe3+ transport system substrate-binding protein
LGREGQTNNGELFDKTFANRTPLENVARQTRIAGQLRESFDEQNMGGTNVAADEYINEMTENAAKGTGGNAAAAVRKAVNVGARYFMGDENYIGMKKWAGAGNNEAPNATKIQSEYEQQMLSNAKQQTEHLDNMASGSKTINHATE